MVGGVIRQAAVSLVISDNLGRKLQTDVSFFSLYCLIYALLLQLVVESSEAVATWLSKLIIPMLKMGRSIPVGHQHDDEVDSGDDVSSPGASDGDDCWDANPRNQHVSIGVCDCFYDTETSQDMQIGQRERLARGISDQILSFYNAGVPFFTKEGMRTIVAQLDAYYQKGSDLSNKLISLPTISGETVEVNIESGNRSPSGSANIELIMYVPILILATPKLTNAGERLCWSIGHIRC